MSRLAELRTAAGMTQRELSIRSGVNPQTISEIERGIGNPTLSTLTALARAFHLEPGELLGEPEAGVAGAAAAGEQGDPDAPAGTQTPPQPSQSASRRSA